MVVAAVEDRAAAAVVRDGGGGAPEALRTAWPSTRVQRCLFHVYMNVTELTDLKPRLAAGKSPRKAAVALSRVPDADPAAEWPASYNQREQDHEEFLDQKSHREDGTVADRRVARRRSRRRTTSSSHGTHASATCCAGTGVFVFT